MRKFSLAVMFLLVGRASEVFAIDWDKITINGYTSFEFEQQLESEGSGNGDPNGSFDTDAIDLVLNFQATDKVRASADLTWEHGAATEDDRGNVAIEYAFVEYTFSDLLKVRFGKMFTPFGVYNQIHTAKPAFLSVKEPASTNKPERIIDDADRFYPRWGSGIAFQGDGSLGKTQFDYDLLFANGDQENTNPFEEDDNSSKSVTARFRFEPRENLRFGTSFYYDRLTDPNVESVHSQGIEAELSASKIRILAEAMIGTQDFRASKSVKQLGWYLQPSYHFENGVTPYLRYEWIDPDTDRNSDTGADFIVGVNWEPSRWFMIKLENDYFKGSRNSSLNAFPGRDYNEIKAAVVLGF